MALKDWKKFGQDRWWKKSRETYGTDWSIYILHKPKARIHKPWQVYFHDGIKIHYSALLMSFTTKSQALRYTKLYMIEH